MLFLLSLRFGQISPLAFFRWFLSEVAVKKNHLKKARGEIWLKQSERRNNTKNYQDEDKKSAINKLILWFFFWIFYFLFLKEKNQLNIIKWNLLTHWYFWWIPFCNFYYYLVLFISLTASQFFMGYLMLKFYSLRNFYDKYIFMFHCNHLSLLYSFKYFNLILIIYTQLYTFK